MAEILVLYLLQTINFKVAALGMPSSPKQLLEQQVRLNLDLCCGCCIASVLYHMHLHCRNIGFISTYNY